MEGMRNMTSAFIAATIAATGATQGPVGAFIGVLAGGLCGVKLRQAQPTVVEADPEGLTRLMADLYDGRRLRDRVEIERRMMLRRAADSQALLDACSPKTQKDPRL